MAIILPEEVKVAICKETTWGTAVTASPKLIPVTPPSLKEVVNHSFDEGIRGQLARDWQGYASTKRAEGTLEGDWFPEEPGFLVASLYGTEDTPDQISTGTFYQHVFKVANTPISLSIHELLPNITDAAGSAGGETVSYLGMMVSRLVIRLNAAEGFLTYQATLVGTQKDTAQSVTFPAAPTTKPLMGWMTDFSLSNAPSMSAKLLDFEITIDREITLRYGAATTQVANVRAARPPRVTMTATLAFLAYQDYARYTATTKDALKLLVATDSIALTNWTSSNPLAGASRTSADPATGTFTTGGGALYIDCPVVVWAESPADIHTNESPVTVTLNGRAVADASLAAGKELCTLEMINERATAY